MITQDIQEVLLSEEQIAERCRELAAQIQADYLARGSIPVVVGLLKGSVPFMAELMKRFTMPVEVAFMKVSSYQGTKSVGDVRIDMDMDLSTVDRALKAVKQMFRNKGAQGVQVVALLDKPDRRVVDIEADYVGFEVPNEFVVGFGLDYNQRYRNLPYIGILKPEVYEQGE